MKNKIFNYIFSHVVDFTNENIIGFITEHMLTLFHLSLPLSTYDIFIGRIDSIRRNEVHFRKYKNPNVIFKSVKIKMLKIINYKG